MALFTLVCSSYVMEPIVKEEIHQKAKKSKHMGLSVSLSLSKYILLANNIFQSFHMLSQ